MNQLARRPLPHMTADEFLAWPGDASGRRFQLVDGEVRPMSPASRIHGAIQANLAYLLVSAVRSAGLPLQVLTEGGVLPRLNASDNVGFRIWPWHLATTFAATRRSMNRF